MTEKIYNTAAKIKEKYGTCNPIELCYFLGIHYITTDLPDSVSGFYMESDGKKAVVVGNSLSRRASLLCAAHELGHALLHCGLNSMFITENTHFPVGKFEREADHFAAALLIDIELINECDYKIEQICCITGLPQYAAEEYMCYLFNERG